MMEPIHVEMTCKRKVREQEWLLMKQIHMETTYE